MGRATAVEKIGSRDGAKTKPRSSSHRAASRESVVATKLPSSTLYNSIVFFLVGPKRVKFGVHKGVLIRKSAFFRAALTGTFKEATEGTVVLQDDSPKVFEVFVSWLYTRKLENTVDEIPTPCSSNRLAKLYIFADRYDVPILRNDAIDALIKNRRENLQIPTSSFRMVYDATPPKDPLRRLLADMVILDTDIRESVVARRESYSVEMLLHLLVVSSE